ncbi:hypothetical protein K488DRAFT_81881 [Vararia minispora EC-137]|uniref:Uncharacterized protein n=1 Tax=Vararia minispora EC-137 TaxID=1314806 RepID=A0ACB8QXT2_9AGAM|nr:hypothetical protein K488DRAFT_81881 [Vararia minispora EC-137]
MTNHPRPSSPVDPVLPFLDRTSLNIPTITYLMDSDFENQQARKHSYPPSTTASIESAQYPTNILRDTDSRPRRSPPNIPRHILHLRQHPTFQKTDLTMWTLKCLPHTRIALNTCTYILLPGKTQFIPVILTDTRMELPSAVSVRINLIYPCDSTSDPGNGHRILIPNTAIHRSRILRLGQLKMKLNNSWLRLADRASPSLTQADGPCPSIIRAHSIWWNNRVSGTWHILETTSQHQYEYFSGTTPRSIAPHLPPVRCNTPPFDPIIYAPYQHLAPRMQPQPPISSEDYQLPISYPPGPA